MATKHKVKSSVWPYFTADKGNCKTKCNLCGLELAYKGGSTSSMKNHLDRKHNKPLTKSSSKFRGATSPASLSSSSESMPRVSLASPKAIQPYITSQFGANVAPKPLTKCQNEELVQGIAWMCALDLRPMNIVSGRGFRRLCGLLNPNFVVPCRTTVTKHVSLLYDQLKATLKKQLRGRQVSVTTDMWTSVSQKGFITVTAHYITDEWVLDCKVQC